ncbi:citryl-CoA lyase [Aureimonas fodinaquatilis]|uniref:citrate synthase (unknown stereospecificity) n=2 Tax=Aureimonas fodinaquatilis TaxID=2565783 RepID=A0A5B0DYC2_9HYPH|nr:citryl-CoA lyase [Aureimonas fodinaquatilis]
MAHGQLSAREQAKLLEAVPVEVVGHGPQAPSIAIARMAMTCGGSVNNAMASAINVLDDVHGGAGQGALVVYCQISERMEQGEPLDTATDSVLRPMLDARQIMTGFGHRFHPIDPRTPRLIELATVARTHGQITGGVLDIAVSVESWLAVAKGKHLPMNIDGITAAIYGELGFDPTMARGLFIISCSTAFSHMLISSRRWAAGSKARPSPRWDIAIRKSRNSRCLNSIDCPQKQLRNSASDAGQQVFAEMP